MLIAERLGRASFFFIVLVEIFFFPKKNRNLLRIVLVEITPGTPVKNKKTKTLSGAQFYKSSGLEKNQLEKIKRIGGK